MPQKSTYRAIILCTEGNIGSIVHLNKILKTKNVEVEGIIISPSAPGGIKKNWKYIKRIGFFYSLIFAFQFIMQHLILGLNIIRHKIFRRNYILPLKSAAGEIPIFETSDIHDDKSKQFIQDQEADLLISANFNQILKPEVIKLTKLGAINIHPANVENYRGAMNYFWVLKNKEKKTGVTIHWMDEKIDTGEVINIKDFKINDNDTQFSINIKTSLIGSLLLRKILQSGNIEKNKEKISEKGKYHSIPEEKDLEDYNLKSPFYRIRQFFWLFKKV